MDCGTTKVYEHLPYATMHTRGGMLAHSYGPSFSAFNFISIFIGLPS